MTSTDSDAINGFYEKARTVADNFRALSAKDLILLHHNDTDGLTSGAILNTLFERQGIKVHRYCLEKPYPQVIARILAGFPSPTTPLVVTDFASGMLDTLNQLDRNKRKIFVLDHHSIVGEETENLTLLNCRTFGLSGDDVCSAGTTCAVFADQFGFLGEDLLGIGLLGAFGDGQFTTVGQWEGVNAELAKRVAELGLVRTSAEAVELKGADGVFRDMGALSRWVDALGAFGYLDGGTDVAIKGLLDGFDDRYQHQALAYRTKFSNLCSAWLSDRVIVTEGCIKYFTLPEQFASMGVKTVGLVCELVRDSEELKAADSYIVGFQAIPQRIPGLGPIDMPSVKISVRVGRNLRGSIRRGTAKSVPEFLKAPTEGVGGFIDACHREAGAVTIPLGHEKQFLKLIAENVG